MIKLIFFLFLAMASLHCKNKNEVMQVNIGTAPVTVCGAQTTDTRWYQTEQAAPLLEGLGDLHYKVSTDNPLAQQYFDQGLILSYAFNHAEAARSFYYASRLDSSCAMCYWGFAYVLGPNYNGGMEPDHYQRAFDAVQKAMKLADGATLKEKQLIQALATRYVKEPVEDRHLLDSSYSAEMKKLHLVYPDDPEIAALYVESIMDLHPWDLWDKQGQPKPWTPEIVAIIERLIKQYPEHPGLHHFYIHAVEASFHPDRGLASAHKFDQGMVPGAGHLVHMSSHIYIRTGDYHEGSLSNIRAIKVDSQYVSSCHAQGVYPLSYYPHNYHFLAATATLEGKKSWAMTASEKMSEHMDRELIKDPAWATLQHYYLIPYFVRVKFGDWDSILARPEPMISLPYVQAIRHYARGMAYLNKKNIPAAREEMNRLDSIARDTVLKDLTIWAINSIADIVSIASKVLQGEIFAAESSYDASIRLLREAVAMEDQLAYNEPPEWFFSVRHHLGAILLENKNYKEAIKIYKEDLNWLPKNGWAQHGLKAAYQNIKDQKSLTAIEKDILESWKYAEITLGSSRVK